VLSSLLTRRMLGLHLLLLVVLVGTGVAGWWQLEAWRHEQADDAAGRADREPVALADVLGPDDPLANEDDGVPVEVHGRYGPTEQQFLVSDRAEGGEDGYWVLSPLLVDGITPPSALLVVRGWTTHAGTLPPVPAGDVTETGVLAPGEEGSADVGPDRVVEAVRIPALVNAVDTDLYSAFLVRTGDSPGPGLEPVTPPADDPSWSAGLRNLAYALQWWLFGGFAVFMWWRMCADERSVASAG
jgi:surfeit locus 1 family protein